jgi:hypothetical protein
MDQSSYLSRCLWQYRESSLYTDLTLVCSDGSLPTHAAMLAGLFAGFGISFLSSEEVPECLFLPDLAIREVETILRTLYRGGKANFFSDIPKKADSLVKIEVCDYVEESELKDVLDEEKYDFDHDQNNSDGDGEDDELNKADITTEELSIDTPLVKTDENKKETGDKRRFKCNVCTRSFKTGGPYRRHKAIVHNEKEADIWADWEALKVKLGLRTGAKRTPIGSTTYTYKSTQFECNQCGTTCSGRKNYTNHLKDEHGYKTKADRRKEDKDGQFSEDQKCDYCEKSFKKSWLRNHLAIMHRAEVLLHHPEIVLNTQCPACDLKFLGAHDLDKHSWEVHGKSSREWKCNVCEEEFANKHELLSHRKKNHLDDLLANTNYLQPKEKDQQCPYCEKMVTKLNFYQHIFRIHKEKRSQHPEITSTVFCNECNEEQFDKAALNSHQIRKHAGSVTCKICSGVYANQKQLDIHMHRHTDQSYSCEHCGKQFNAKPDLMRHMRRHEGPDAWKLKCPHCTRKGGFQSEEALQRHLKDWHSGAQYLCSQCPKAFTNQMLRHNHEMNIHTEKTIKCDECDKMFVNIGRKNEHIRHVHEKKMDKICPHCGEAFSRIAQYEAHVNRHTNNRPFSCETCGKDFLIEHHLQKHMQRHTRPFSCDNCGQSFGSLGDLKAHTRTVHEGVQIECRHGCGFLSSMRGNRNRHEKACKLNPVPNAPYTVSQGTASQFTLDNYNMQIAK